MRHFKLNKVYIVYAFETPFLIVNKLKNPSLYLHVYEHKLKVISEKFFLQRWELNKTSLLAIEQFGTWSNKFCFGKSIST